MPRLSVIVVNYNTRSELELCLASLDGADEVIVVDNASTDGSAEMVSSSFPSVLLIANDRNRGFGAANNQGLEVMTGEIALLLNSDARAEPGALDVLKGVMEDSSVVACGGMLRFPDGRVQQSCCNSLTLWAVFCEQWLLEKAFPRSRVFSPYWETHRLLASPPAESHDVEQVMGACLCMRPVERFDERFFLYCEDTEICLRLRSRGRIVYVPGAEFVHELGASSDERWEAVARYNRGKELYFTIHRGKFASFIAWKKNREGAFIRLVIWSVASVLTLFTVERFRKKVALFWKVLTAPKAGPPAPLDS